MIRTLNQIVAEFQEIATQHRQINSFAFGTLDDFASSGTTQYPANWMQCNSISYSTNSTEYTFDVWIVDRVKKDRSNLTEVLSDTNTTAGDIIAQAYNPQYKWRYTPATMSAVYEPFMEDEVAGWNYQITILLPFTKDNCQIPFITTPTIQTT